MIEHYNLVVSDLTASWLKKDFKFWKNKTKFTFITYNIIVKYKMLLFFIKKKKHSLHIYNTVKLP